MDRPISMRSRFAVLIGISGYAERPLSGCVQDVQEMKKYLESIWPSVHVQMLSTGRTNDSGPHENGTLWPTYDNVTSSLENVTSLASPGDFVYLHYSGHGTRIEPCSNYGNTGSGDLALDLVEDFDGTDVRYLRGLELAYILNNMVQKGLLVTLVLDCCFSGCVLRDEDNGDGEIRELRYNAEVDKTYPPDPTKCTSYGTGRSTYRDGEIIPTWLINPEGYTILTASGPHQVAREIKLATGQKHGAFSYFLLQTLRKFGAFGTRQQSLHRHIAAKFLECQARQNPMLFGNRNLCFFGGLQHEFNSNAIPIVRNRKGNFLLQAGQAHGVCDGDQFGLDAFHPEKIASGQAMEDVVIAKVVKSGDLTSELKLSGGTCGRMDIETGWIARPLTRLSLRKFPILLMDDLPHIDTWTQATKYRPSLKISSNKVPGCEYTFHVTVTADEAYEIRDEGNKVIHTTHGAAHDQESYANYILDLLSHLAQFKLVQSLTNSHPVSPLHHSFTAQLLRPTGEICEPGARTTVHHNDILRLEIKNTSNQALYLHVYNMRPGWQVVNVLKDPFDVIPARDIKADFSGTCTKKMRMTVPQELQDSGCIECEDVLKVFVTSQPTSLLSLELPGIQERYTEKIGSASQNDSRQASSASSTVVEDWAALNFFIQITMA